MRFLPSNPFFHNIAGWENVTDRIYKPKQQKWVNGTLLFPVFNLHNSQLPVGVVFAHKKMMPFQSRKMTVAKCEEAFFAV